MRILVTGGTGFIGKPLVRALVAQGHEVIVYGREDDIDRPDNVKMVTGNITNKKALRDSFAGKINAVYHLAALQDEDDPEMVKANVTGAEKVVELCKEKKIGQLIYLSYAGVLGETNRPARENASYNPKSRYDKTKALAEKIIRYSGVPYTIIRTPLILGPSLRWMKIFDAIKKGHPVIGSGKNKMHMAYMPDVIDFMLLVLNNQKALNHVFHTASRDLLTYEEVHGLIARHLKTRPNSEKMPLPKARIMSKLHAIKSAAQLKYPEMHMTRQHIETMTRNHALSIQKAKDVLGFSPAYTTPEAIYETIRNL